MLYIVFFKCLIKIFDPYQESTVGRSFVPTTRASTFLDLRRLLYLLVSSSKKEFWRSFLGTTVDVKTDHSAYGLKIGGLYTLSFKHNKFDDLKNIKKCRR